MKIELRNFLGVVVHEVGGPSMSISKEFVKAGQKLANTLNTICTSKYQMVVANLLRIFYFIFLLI
jgi:hypothetical protein